MIIEAAIAVLVLGFVVIGLVGPLLAQLRLRRLRTPTTSDRSRMEILAVDLPKSVDRFVVIETVGDNSIEVAIRGPPGHRVLFITDFVLFDLGEKIAAPLLAAERARLRVWYAEYRVLIAGGILGIGLATFTGIIPFDLGFSALIVGALLAFAVGRRLQYRADAIAGTAIGREQLANAFESVAALRDQPIQPRGSWRRYFDVQPPLGARIERLREPE